MAVMHAVKTCPGEAEAVYKHRSGTRIAKMAS